MKSPLLEGRLFGRRVPAHMNLGCLAMFIGTTFAFFLSAAFLGLLMQASFVKEGPYWFEAILVATSFVTGILVGIICKERRGLYAILTSIMYPLLVPPPMLLGYYLMTLMDGEFLHPFVVPIVLCPPAAYFGAKSWEKMLDSLKKR